MEEEIFCEWDVSGFGISKKRPSESISWGKKVTNIIRLYIIPWTLSILSAISPDVWINNMEQFSYVSWTDVTVFTIFFKVGEQNTIDFSSADGLRNAFGLLRRAVLGWLFSVWHFCSQTNKVQSVKSNRAVYWDTWLDKANREGEKEAGWFRQIFF